MRDRYEEETGTRESDPALNAEIRRQLGLSLGNAPRNSGLASRLDLSRDKIMQAMSLIGNTNTGEHITSREMLWKLAALKRLGFPVPSDYRHLRHNLLYRVFREMESEAYMQARNYGLGPYSMSSS